jgi:hypothetical protein
MHRTFSRRRPVPLLRRCHPDGAVRELFVRRYFLSRLPGQLGMYLALTGARLRAIDCLYAGIGTHFVRSEAIPALLARSLAPLSYVF